MENLVDSSNSASVSLDNTSVEDDDQEFVDDGGGGGGDNMVTFDFINGLVAEMPGCESCDEDDDDEFNSSCNLNKSETNSTSESSVKIPKGQRKRDRKAAKARKEAERDETSQENPSETAAMRAARLEQRRKINDEYVGELRHKGLHNLSGEIDRCLKKVSEGVETFEDIWQKVHNATNTNQKEKYEADLKKEIKKLQRLRDQIKSWIASGEIKDKSTLVDNRKLIETQMERFKVVERETKTKAYSKEGLGAAQKLDPTTREREDLNNWLSASIDSMQLQIDQFECEIESILAAKKKRLDKDKQDRLDELKTVLERHRFHVTKLETLMRMLDNLAADVNALRTFLNQVKKIKDDIDYYLDSNQEPEFEENEFIYDDIEGLEEFDDGLTGQPVPATGEEGEGGVVGLTPAPLPLSSSPVVSTSGNNSPISPVHSSESSDNARRKSSDDISNSNSKVLRPVAVKANLNHSPSGGVVGSKGAGGGTPNNSSPSSGLSNHVSSLSSLSSSPTHNYHNALNNSKSISHTDSIEHNNSLTGASNATGALSKSPTNNSNSLLNSFEVMSLTSGMNGIVENGGSPPMLEDHGGSIITQGSGTCGSTTTMENGLISPPRPTSSQDHVGLPTLSNSTSLSLGGENHTNQHQLFGDSSDSSSLQNSSFLQQTFNGLGNNFCDNSNSSSLGLNNGNNSSSGSVLSANVIGLTSSSALGGNSVVGGGGDSESANETTTTNSNILSTTNSNSISSGVPPPIPTTSTNTNQSHNNSNTGLLSQQHIQLFQELQLQQIHQQQEQQNASASSAPPQGAQASSNNLETTPISDYLRLHQSQGHLFNRILSESDSMASLKSMAQDVLDRTGITLGDHAKNIVEKTAQIPPLLGVAPLGPVPLTKDHQQQFQMMDSAHCHVPVSADSERMRQFLPRNPYPTPHYYPQNPLSNSDSFEFFQRLSIETLFFIFYYLEGTKAQYLAAKVLKKQSWRFHTKYMMWFQRHEEPKVINDEYEQGTYVYFDIDKWGQRKKDGFVFEYRYLEDRDLG